MTFWAATRSKRVALNRWFEMVPSGSRCKAIRLAKDKPVVRSRCSPSIVDVPTAGCWSFQASWGSYPSKTAIINLDVLPAGTLPTTAPPLTPTRYPAPR